MKRIFSALMCAGVLAGCMQGPTSPNEVREATAGGHLFAQRNTVQVSRSLSSVTSSFREGSAKCFNRTVRSTSTTPGPYGPQVQSIVVTYKGNVTTKNGRTELSLHRTVPSLFGPSQGFSYLVDAVSANGGTQLTIHGGRFGYKNLNAAVEQWARGGAIVCPELP